MISADDRYVIVFNGEVYNHAEMREDLSARGMPSGVIPIPRLCWQPSVNGGCMPRSGSSTACSHSAYGIEKIAACTWSDRLGIKPLYYGWMGTTFLFGSELKALRAHSSFNLGIDRESLALYLKFNYIPAPHTIHPGIYKLVPGAS